MTTEQHPTLVDMARELGRQIGDALQAMSAALADPTPGTAPEPVDIAAARDQVVTAALRYAAAEGDAGTSLADTNAALEVLDDALAGYVDATGCREKPPTVTAVEALKPGNEVEFTVRATVDHGGLANTPNDNFMGVEFVAEIGRDFRVIKTGESAS